GSSDLIHDTGSNVDAQPRKQPTTNEGAYDANGDVADETKPPPGNYFPRQPSCDETNQQYDEQTFARQHHIFPLLKAPNPGRYKQICVCITQTGTISSDWEKTVQKARAREASNSKSLAPP